MLELTKENQEKILNLLSSVPDLLFKSIHLRIEDNKAIVNQVDINDNVAISFSVNLEDIDTEDIFYCSIPNNKKIISHIFSGKYDKVILNKENIVCKDNKKEITVSLLDISIDDLSMFPLNSDEMFEMLEEAVGNDNDTNCYFELEQDNIQELLDLFSFVDVKKDVNIQIGFNKSCCMFNVKDILNNNVKYKIEDIEHKGSNTKFVVSFDYYLYNIIRYMKRKDYNNVKISVTSKFIILSISDEDMSLIYSLSSLNNN